MMLCIAAPQTANAENATTVLEESGIGEVKIHENVISSLARRAALGVEGVSRLAGSLLVDNIAEIVGSRRMQDRAVTIEILEDNRVAIEVKINILIGYRLPEVAEKGTWVTFPAPRCRVGDKVFFVERKG